MLDAFQISTGYITDLRNVTECLDINIMKVLIVTFILFWSTCLQYLSLPPSLLPFSLQFVLLQ
jgi:hypothetical protein